MFHCFSKTAAGRAALTGLTGLMLTGLLAGCGTQARNAYNVQQDLADAQHEVQVKNTDAEARQCIDRAIAVDPQNPDTYFGPSTPPNPSDPLPPLSIALVFESVGDLPALADYMAQAVQKFPGDIRGYEALAETQTQLGRLAERKSTALKEIPLLSKALQKPGAQNIPLSSEMLARAYWEAGDPVSGAAEFRKVIAAYPSLSSYPQDLGPYNSFAYECAEANTNLPEALALAQKALAQAKQAGMDDQGIAGIQDTLGWVQYRQGDYADAAQNLLQAADASPREAEIRYHLGLVYAAQGNKAAARAELGHAVLLAQGYAAAQQALDTLPKDSLPPSSPPAAPKTAVLLKAAIAASR